MKRRLKLSSRDLQYVIAFALVATVVTSVVAYTTLFPLPKEQFFAMWILGSDGLAEDYFPNNNSTLTAGEAISWTLGVYNHMNGLEYVVLRVKMLNSTLSSPDELTGTPSPVSTIFEFSRILVDNETWSIPFTWRIVSLSRQTQSVMITGLSVNQTLVTGNLASAILGINFRFIFELWFYDASTNMLSFAWTSSGATHSAWTQIWFNATMTS
ncbi:MAG: hypothetical protein ABSC50_07190 [Candidatus Bathyarchaeia archaeon]